MSKSSPFLDPPLPFPVKLVHRLVAGPAGPEEEIALTGDQRGQGPALEPRAQGA